MRVLRFRRNNSLTDHDAGKKDEPLGKSDYSPISSRPIGGGAQHLFVKNHVNDTEFDIARDPRFAAAFRLIIPDA